MSYSVGEVARIAGVTVRTLHHYDDIGLLPASARTAGGYRAYTESDIVRLQQIRSYRELGFGLDEIAEMLRNGDPLDHLREQHQLLLERSTGCDRSPRPWRRRWRHGSWASHSTPRRCSRSSVTTTRRSTPRRSSSAGATPCLQSRLTTHYDDQAPGFAPFVRDAVHANADRAGAVA